MSGAPMDPQGIARGIIARLKARHTERLVARSAQAFLVSGHHMTSFEAHMADGGFEEGRGWQTKTVYGRDNPPYAVEYAITSPEAGEHAMRWHPVRDADDEFRDQLQDDQQ